MNEPVAWIDYLEHSDVYDLNVSGRGIPLYTHPAKTLTADEKSKLIGTLKWAEDLLRLSCNDEAVNDVQDCLMILRKAQEK